MVIRILFRRVTRLFSVERFSLTIGMKQHGKRILTAFCACVASFYPRSTIFNMPGLRPFRDGGVRLEHERTTDGIDLVHCYGHSGAGVTLSWGCAKDVVDIVKGLLPSHSKQQDRRAEHEQLWRLTRARETLAVRAKI
jgi:hypothetical protein